MCFGEHPDPTVMMAALCLTVPREALLGRRLARSATSSKGSTTLAFRPSRIQVTYGSRMRRPFRSMLPSDYAARIIEVYQG
jgi:hypothetical protein